MDFQVFQNENSDKCRPDLDFHRILEVPNEGFDGSKGFDISKKDPQFAIFACIILVMVEAAQEKLLNHFMVCLFSLSQTATLLNFWIFFLDKGFEKLNFFVFWDALSSFCGSSFL